MHPLIDRPFGRILTVCIAYAWVFGSSVARGQSLDIRKDCGSLSAPGQYPDYDAVPSYSIEYRVRSTSVPTAVTLHIAVPAQAMNSGSMTRLACKLATEFQQDKIVEGLIFDDKNAARNLAPRATDQFRYGEYLWHLKAHYKYDRDNGIHFIELAIPELKNNLLSLRYVRIWLEDGARLNRQ